MNVRQLLLAACLSCVQGFAREEPAIPKLECPGYLKSCIDPVFGNTITRITGKAGSPIAAIDGRWAEVARHGYSKRAVWNADMTLLYLDRHQGKPGALFLDGNTYAPLFECRLSLTTRRKPMPFPLPMARGFYGPATGRRTAAAPLQLMS